MRIETLEDSDSSRAPETLRRSAAVFLMWGGWTIAAAVAVYAVTTFDPSEGHFAPQWVSFAFIGNLCIGIAGTLARSRHRLTDTIIAAFKLGVEAAEARNAAPRNDK